MTTGPKAKLRTCLFFESGGEAAAEFYVGLLPGSRIEEVYRPDPNGPPLVVEFTLAGAPYMILNGGMAFEHTPAVSISVLTRDQDETDRLWDALTEDGEEGDCGWLKDRWGMHWQIVPEALPIMMASDDKIAAGRAHAAMMQMNRIDIAALTAAFEGREETGQ